MRSVGYLTLHSLDPLRRCWRDDFADLQVPFQVRSDQHQECGAPVQRRGRAYRGVAFVHLPRLPSPVEIAAATTSTAPYHSLYSTPVSVRQTLISHEA